MVVVTMGSLLYVSFLLRDGEVFGFDFEAQPVVGAHVDVRDPNKGELGDYKSAPSRVEHLELGQNQKRRCHVVAEAVFARKQVKEFSLIETPAILAAVFAELARLAEDLLVRDGPGDARDGEAEQ